MASGTFSADGTSMLIGSLFSSIEDSRILVYSCVGVRRISRTGPSSTSRPFCMTTTRSQRSATTPKLWVTMMTPMSSRSRSSRSRSRISACTVTSNAVVGSSAISRSGSQLMAPAISTRWAMPPETSCG